MACRIHQTNRSLTRGRSGHMNDGSTRSKRVDGDPAAPLATTPPPGEQAISRLRELAWPRTT
jgi:hypothetical protein